MAMSKCMHTHVFTTFLYFLLDDTILVPGNILLFKQFGNLCLFLLEPIDHPVVLLLLLFPIIVALYTF